ncbi:Hint domain-containing protein, partial [Endozoicomonas acroporae]|uniref:Hint domain-containing protein n=1 Tax=Endozoicomonas acroporae TaxID=1701104 RepID=UPI003D7A7E8A
GVVLDPQGTIKEIADQFKDDITELLTGSAYERGKVIGENISPASLAGIAKKVLSLPSVKNRPLDVGCSSFTAETLVMTPDGMRSIEELRVGDLVYSRSDINYSDNPQKITHLYNREVDHYFRILTPQSTIRTTAEHPFWVQGEGWVKAESLRNGHAIAAADGDRVIQDIAPIRETVRVYNFSVDQTQSYFAGEDLLWVHNSNSSCSIDEQRQRLFKERLDSVIEQVP